MTNRTESGHVRTWQRERQRHLILDCCGVILGEPMEPLFVTAAGLSGRHVDTVRSMFREDFRDDLWLGKLALSQFWSAYSLRLGLSADAIPQLEAAIRRSLSVRIPASDLADWQRHGVDITVLSNMRTEWIRPVLEAGGHLASVDRLLISDEIAAAKPSPAAFRIALGTRERPTMFMDDSPANLEAMRDAFGGVQCELVRSRTDARSVMSRWLKA